MSMVDNLVDINIKQKAEKFFGSLLERKFFFLVYSIIEKWVILSWINAGMELDTNTLYFVIGKDVLALILLGIVAFEKIKLAYNKQ